jgi:hypothetical protein
VPTLFVQAASMSQRPSNFMHLPDGNYPTPPATVRAVVPWLLKRAKYVWEPAPLPDATSALSRVLRNEGFHVTETTGDFLAINKLPDPRIQAGCTNPPFGAHGRLAVRFAEHALELGVPVIALLLKIDFDSGSTRVRLFRDCPYFAGKIVLLHRVNWFPGGDTNTFNYAWYCWDRAHRGPPIISYACNRELKR